MWRFCPHAEHWMRRFCALFKPVVRLFTKLCVMVGVILNKLTQFVHPSQARNARSSDSLASACQSHMPDQRAGTQYTNISCKSRAPQWPKWISCPWFRQPTCRSVSVMAGRDSSWAQTLKDEFSEQLQLIVLRGQAAFVFSFLGASNFLWTLRVHVGCSTQLFRRTWIHVSAMFPAPSSFDSSSSGGADFCLSAPKYNKNKDTKIPGICTLLPSVFRCDLLGFAFT